MTPQAYLSVLLVCIGSLLVTPVSAHPMPNTVIAVTLHEDGATFDISVPVPELRLALPGSWPSTADLLAEPRRAAVESYFQSHFAVRSKLGITQRSRVQSLAVSQATDADVGQYQELQVRMFVATSDSFDPQDFVLAYDAVIHQVPNHFALVQFNDRAATIGVIRFDFKQNMTPPLPVKATVRLAR